MPFKTILVHMSDDDRHAARLDLALAVADRFDSTLDLLYVTSPVSMPEAMTGRGASMAYIAEATAHAERVEANIQAEVASRCTGRRYCWSVGHGDHSALLSARAVYADLAVVTQAHPRHLEDRVPSHLPDLLPLTAPCPTLVVPWAGSSTRPVGGHALVAWAPCREAGRAVREAVPLLKLASEVTILMIDPETEETAPADPAPADGAAHTPSILSYLQRHGVVARPHIVRSPDVSDGEVILKVTQAVGADLLVMGAYGHSRWRELVLGGATRTVLTRMTVPVLMAH